MYTIPPPHTYLEQRQLITYRLSQIGEDLCGSGSEEMASSIRTQCSNYFKRYHATKLDDLRVFLENEAWTPCPVRSDFSVLHLQVSYLL